MQELDKTSLGLRIRQVRAQAGLRQWELARMLGTTQSAVHKYEHGVVPEPRRLVELARIGETSVEWILTGRHWENGSPEQTRVPPGLLDTAAALRSLADEDRASVDDALRILREAVRAVEPVADGNAPQPDTLVSALRDHAAPTLGLLTSAWRIQTAVLRCVTEDAARRLSSSRLAAEDDSDREPPTPP